MNRKFEVEEKERYVAFADGMRETFRDIKSVDAKGGDWLRLETKNQYIMINPNNVNFMIIPLESKVR